MEGFFESFLSNPTRGRAIYSFLSSNSHKLPLLALFRDLLRHGHQTEESHCCK